MKWFYVIIIILLASCSSTLGIGKNRHKKIDIELESINPIMFSEIMMYDDPHRNDEQYSYKFELFENSKNLTPIGQKISLLDTTYFRCNLGLWTPWYSITYEHHPVSFDGWIKVLERSNGKVILIHEIILIRKEQRSMIFSGRVKLK